MTLQGSGVAQARNRPELPSENALLLLEYERSSEFCNHVDGVRNVITRRIQVIISTQCSPTNR